MTVHYVKVLANGVFRVRLVSEGDSVLSFSEWDSRTESWEDFLPEAEERLVATQILELVAQNIGERLDFVHGNTHIQWFGERELSASDSGQ